MNTIKRACVAILVIYSGVMLLLFVRSYFDQKDLDLAVRLVHEFIPENHDQTIFQMMVADVGEAQGALHCDASLLSRYDSAVLVVCGLEQGPHDKNSKHNFEWLVHVVDHKIEARNQHSSALLEGNGVEGKT